MTVEELPKLAEKGHRFYEEGNLPGMFVPSIFVKNWTEYLSQGMGVIFALTKDGELLGALGALAYPDPNDGKIVCSEMFWYVFPESRGRGLLLLNAFEDWAKEMGADRIAMVHLTRLAPDSLRKVYEHRGYHELEIHYIKTL